MTRTLVFGQPSIAAQIADSAIGAYQRYISPHKGFCCAYRAQTGKRSCSAYGRAVVQRLGLLALLVGLMKQFERCKVAYVTLRQNDEQRQGSDRNKNSKLDCDPLGVGDCATDMACDAIPCDGIPCDCSF